MRATVNFGPKSVFCKFSCQVSPPAAASAPADISYSTLRPEISSVEKNLKDMSRGSFTVEGNVLASSSSSDPF